MDCYAIPGLGATAELFANLNLPSWINVKSLEWTRCKPAQPLQAYAESLLDQVDATVPHMYLGYSFGAAVAVEMARMTNPLLTTVVSGAVTSSEIPFYLRELRALGMHHLAPQVQRLPDTMIRFGAGIAFGVKDHDSRAVLLKMIRNIDPDFYECGLIAFMDWSNSVIPDNLLLIHGRRDLLLPFKPVHPVASLDGGHFIIYTHGREIGRLVHRHIRSALNERGIAPPA